MALKAFSGGSLFADVSGADTPALLALHGWGRSHADFAAVLGAGSAISVDFPGFGASPVPPSAWGSPEYAEAIRPLWDQFDVPPVVVAHSFGGRVAMHLAMDMPMRALVLIGVPLIRPESNAKPAPIYRVARALSKLGALPDSVMDSLRRKYGSPDYLAATGVMREVFVKVVNESYADQLGNMRVPVRMVWGRNDTAAPLVLAEQARDLMAAGGTDVELTVLDGVGHHVMAEKPEAVRSLLGALTT